MRGHNTTNLRGVVRLFVCMFTHLKGFKGFVSTYEPWTDACDYPKKCNQGFPCDFGMSSSFIMCFISEFREIKDVLSEHYSR